MPRCTIACADISGTYRPPYEGDNADVLTTVTIRQYGCDSISISAMARGKKFFESETRVYYPKDLSLKGLPAPSELECFNAYWGACASYLATPSAVVRTARQKELQATADPVHGGCFYTVSALARNADGELVETPQEAKCEDGYVGVVAPVVWPKAPAN